MVLPANKKQFDYYDIIYILRQAGTLCLSHESLKSDLEYKMHYGENKQFLTIALPTGIKFNACTITIPSACSILEVRERTNFFDFYNLKNLYRVNEIINDDAYQDKINGINLEITFFVTYRCNYKCPFCWQRHDAGQYVKVTPQHFNAIKVADALNRFKPKSVYFTGGEPTMYKDLFVLMSKLDSDIIITMTSNIGSSFDVKMFTELVSPHQCRNLGCSFHPSETTDSHFLQKLDQLLYANFPVFVESVLYAPDLNRLLGIKSHLQQRGINIRYDRCTLHGGQQHILSQAEEYIVRELIGVETIGSDTLHIPPMPVPGINKMQNRQGIILCPAGHKSFHIDPLGDVYCCMSAIDRSRLFGPWALPHYQSIGNISDPNFVPLEEPILCWEAFRCSACDYEQLQDAWHFFSTDRPPIPE